MPGLFVIVASTAGTLGAIVTLEDARIAGGVIIGALLGVLALRSQALKLVREDRDAQKDAREKLEVELTRVRAERDDLRDRPNLETHAAMLGAITESLKAHDEGMRAVVPGIVASLDAIADKVGQQAETGDRVAGVLDRLEHTLEHTTTALDRLADTHDEGATS